MLEDSYAGSPDFQLDENTVDVWRARMDVGDDQVSALSALLSADERLRASRFHFARDCRRFCVARGVLRLLLGRYTGGDPRGLKFVYGAMGKPALIEARGLRFNAAHSHEVAVYAVGLHREIGVDVEFNRPLADMEKLAASAFSASEQATLRQTPAAQQHEAFFNAWTRKEAYIKATGDGLSFPLDQFDVSLKPGEPARLLHVAGRPGEVKRWTLQAFQPAAGYTAALAVEGCGWQLRFGQWDGTWL